ncbi:unnamed protein product [Microthlaspi erraticum]|uniref:Protein kinase domain-containing protein n=1 Tax=Microthlaspi erraticum TaxID=1685480 RepID=A0A6D2J4M0_9BRAS|nr:unnamed protein product [Microthlaspi erraticum]
MKSDGSWRFHLRRAFSIIFLIFLPLNLNFCLCFNTQEIAEVHDHVLRLFDSSEDNLLLQSGAYGNRRSLAVGASPPSSDTASSVEPEPEPQPLPPVTPPPPADETPPPPPQLQEAQPPTQSPVTKPLPLPPPSLGTKKKSPNLYMIVGIVVGVSTVSVALVIFFLIFSRKIPIKPWTSSGQLKDALLPANVPRLQLSELQAACEDFSNIIGSFSDGTIYKGTLSTGAEIAVASIAAAGWSAAMETQLLQKVHNLSKVDHNNFLKVVGFCHEDEPFNRMLVFEYAPNGSLSEHLHSQHAEHLDWPTRLRITMGLAYCLEHMHNLNPPILHTNLDSSSVYLSEDNAAKVSDFSVLNCISPSKECSSSKNLLEQSLLDPQTNVFSFGAIVFEIISGKFPDPDSLFIEPKPARDLVDPTLTTFQEDVVERLLEVVRQCMNPYSAQRPTMREVVVKLREITGVTADAAMPRLSPRWWTELEIITTQAH